MGQDELLRLAASLDQVSPHVLATAVVKAAAQRNLVLAVPSSVEEVTGRGVRGLVDGRHGGQRRMDRRLWEGTVGSGRKAARWSRAMSVFVAVDGVPVGLMVLDDPIRTDAGRTIRNLRRGRIDRIVMVTGDRAVVADTVGRR